jgi:uncharacterized protein
MTAGFGIERLGLFSLRYPWVCLILVALVTPVLLYGASRLEFSSDLREIFDSRSDAFETLDEVNVKFPGSEREVQVVIEGDGLVTASRLATLRDLQTRLAKWRACAMYSPSSVL